ncbi:hypothetical protein KOW79_008727 [Hemibagrus wyckioides]|uniref:Uncharacterized protein n=1 Tax=Hemibagrus wyckioides TaxID=337641 RepID=A0A9D3NR69_9TELE|nr:hypothetical protein KOW79_008727 [Hemibagrus wyckioides]
MLEIFYQSVVICSSTLSDTIKIMECRAAEVTELKNEWEEEQEAHRLLKSQYQERMENLTNNEKLLKDYN